MLTPPDRTRTVVLKLRETIGENAGEGGSHRTDQVEDSISLLKFVSRIPAAEKVGTA